MEFTVIYFGFALLLMELCVDWLQILQILQDQKPTVACFQVFSCLMLNLHLILITV